MASSGASHLAFYGAFPQATGQLLRENGQWTARPHPRREAPRSTETAKDVLSVITIVQSPDPVLNTVCEPCDPEDRSLRKLAKQMAKAMYKNDGCGIAAPQLGVTKRLIVVDCNLSEEQNPIVLVNPVLVETQGDPVVEGEGCLSCPGISVPIERAPWARVRYFDLDGEEWEIEGDGLLGRCLQHELDHLEGVTLFERCDPVTRLRVLREYELARAAGARPGETSVEPRVR